jgi:hypothetical protein
MSSSRRVPETRLMGEGELSADHAWRALRRYGGWRLFRDAMVRFRYGDGFSHARALGLQLCLAAVPFLIALHGLATKLELQQGGRVVADTVLALTPGASQSLVGQLAADEHLREIGDVALLAGLLTAVVALMTAVGQVERGANRIYGVERDRPALIKYVRALILAVFAGLPALGCVLSAHRWKWRRRRGRIHVVVLLMVTDSHRTNEREKQDCSLSAAIRTAHWAWISAFPQHSVLTGRRILEGGREAAVRFAGGVRA